MSKIRITGLIFKWQNVLLKIILFKISRNNHKKSKSVCITTYPPTTLKLSIGINIFWVKLGQMKKGLIYPAKKAKFKNIFLINIIPQKMSALLSINCKRCLFRNKEKFFIKYLFQNIFSPSCSIFHISTFHSILRPTQPINKFYPHHPCTCTISSFIPGFYFLLIIIVYVPYTLFSSVWSYYGASLVKPATDSAPSVNNAEHRDFTYTRRFIQTCVS